MTRPFDRVLVANRGEIALRIARTLRKLHVVSVGVYRDDERDSPHTAGVDEAVRISSYLDAAQIVDAAVRTRCDALHPGYGFLAENAGLARACEAAGIVFVGPPPSAIEAMGDKINAKRLVASAGVPVVPGRGEPGWTDEQLVAAAAEIGMPVLLKPSAGGGGKGMRRVEDPSDLPDAIAAARREAAGAFGDPTLLVERFVETPRHIEIQIFGDQRGALVSLGERECTLQRRHQKIIEEAPSPLLSPGLRSAMGASAVAAASACGYVGAGTVEFIVSAADPATHYFMEMNTRLQVEHPVTEAVLDVDLVEWQIRVAAGERLPWASTPQPRGHAVEARVYAEDPSREFLPAAGRILRLSDPRDLPGVRVDSGVADGVTVGTSYDPMLAKVVAWGEDRGEALDRLADALSQTVLLGVTTNVGFLRRLVSHPEVTAGRIDTGTVERLLPELSARPDPQQVATAAALLSVLLAEPPGPALDPWDHLDAWRVTGAAPRTSRWRVDGHDAEVTLTITATGSAQVDGIPEEIRFSQQGPDLWLETDGVTSRYSCALDGDTVWLGRDGDAWMVTRQRETAGRAGPAVSGSGTVTSPMPGTVLAVHVAAGDRVHAGQRLVTVEAMKMEHAVVAVLDGTVTQVMVKPGDPVKLDEPLAVVTPAKEEQA